MPKTMMGSVCGGTILTYDEEKKQSKMIFPKDMIATLSSETISQVMEGYDKICVKPAVDTCSGVGVNLFDLSNNVLYLIGKTRKNAKALHRESDGLTVYVRKLSDGQMISRRAYRGFLSKQKQLFKTK